MSPAVQAYAPVVTADRVRLRALSSDERDWLVAQLRGAAELVARYNGDGSPATLEDLDDCLERWTSAEPSSREPTEDVVAMLGAAFGAHLVDQLALDWVVVTDTYGTDIGVIGQPGDFVIAPMSATAKRVHWGQSRFFQDLADKAADRLRELRTRT